RLLVTRLVPPLGLSRRQLQILQACATQAFLPLALVYQGCTGRSTPAHIQPLPQRRLGATSINSRSAPVWWRVILFPITSLLKTVQRHLTLPPIPRRGRPALLLILQLPPLRQRRRAVI